MSEGRQVLPEIRLIREAWPGPGEKPYEWADPEIGHRSKLGGEPSFIQDAKDWPKCSCRQEMTFYGQLDTYSEKFDLCDCGLIYVFVCFDCFETKSILHGY